MRVLTAALGPLSPSDVSVEVVYGAPGDDDEIVDPLYVTLQPDAPAALAPFGYTVRVLPSPLLASRAELGLVTYPEVTARPARRGTGAATRHRPFDSPCARTPKVKIDSAGRN
jgi:hypothetical protein